MRISILIADHPINRLSIFRTMLYCPLFTNQVIIQRSAQVIEVGEFNALIHFDRRSPDQSIIDYRFFENLKNGQLPQKQRLLQVIEVGKFNALIHFDRRSPDQSIMDYRFFENSKNGQLPQKQLSLQVIEVREFNAHIHFDRRTPDQSIRLTAKQFFYSFIFG